MSTTWTTPGPGAPAPAGRSAWELFRDTAAETPLAPALGYRPPPDAPYRWLSYGRASRAAAAAAAALLADPRLAPGDRVGVYGRNSPSWIVSLMAVGAAGMVAVPLYDSLGVGAVQYVCRHSEVKVALVSAERLGVFAESWAEVPSVERVVVFAQYGLDGSDDEEGAKSSVAPAEEAIAEAGLAEDERVVTLAALVAGAPTEDYAPALPEPDIEHDFVVLYTSGTTGDPKGVVISNRALVTQVATNLLFLKQQEVPLGKDDCFFSFLPLAHIYAIQTEANVFCVGGRIAYFRGDLRLMQDDLAASRPTVFAGVPRVYARFQQKIRDAVAGMSFVKRALFNYAYSSQAYNVRVGRQRTALWDMLVFNKIRDGLMPESKFLVSGSAPLSPETSEFLSVCLKVPVLQGYGSSETLGGVTCESYARTGEEGGTCGKPLPGIELKLVDIPAMDYLTTDKPFPRGEVCVRAPCCMTGYFRNEEETKKVFDDEGFFHTGDVGCRLADGSLTIVDRVKSLFKLAQGEYVSPESIENELCKASLVGQIFIHGNSVESNLLAAVVPDIPAAKAWAAENAPDTKDPATIAELPAFKKEVLRQLLAAGEDAKLKGYEKIKSEHQLLLEASDLNELGQAWHTGNELMTPSFKIKRPQLAKKYESQFDAMYAAMK